MRITDLARSLDISRQMVYKSRDQGMPTDSLEAAIAWRKRNIDPFRSKTGRIGSNAGIEYQPAKVKKSMTDTLIMNSMTEVLTHIIPSLWFGQVGWLGTALREQNVEVTPEQLINAQSILFLIYMEVADEFLKSENRYTFPSTLTTRQGDKDYPQLIARLNQILSEDNLSQ